MPEECSTGVCVNYIWYHQVGWLQTTGWLRTQAVVYWKKALIKQEVWTLQLHLPFWTSYEHWWTKSLVLYVTFMMSFQASLSCATLKMFLHYDKIDSRLLMMSYSWTTNVVFLLTENDVTKPAEFFLGDCWLV